MLIVCLPWETSSRFTKLSRTNFILVYYGHTLKFIFSSIKTKAGADLYFLFFWHRYFKLSTE